MPASSLTVTTAQRGVINAFAAHVDDSCAIVAAAQKAPELSRDDKGTPISKPEGMSEKDYRIACDALKAARLAPLYLTEAYKMRELGHKLAAGVLEDQAPKLVRHVVHVVEAKQYERVRVGKAIDVTCVEQKEPVAP